MPHAFNSHVSTHKNPCINKAIQVSVNAQIWYLKDTHSGPLDFTAAHLIIALIYGLALEH